MARDVSTRSTCAESKRCAGGSTDSGRKRWGPSRKPPSERQERDGVHDGRRDQSGWIGREQGGKGGWRASAATGGLACFHRTDGDVVAVGDVQDRQGQRRGCNHRATGGRPLV